MVALGGCATGYRLWATDADAAASTGPSVPAVASRGAPVPPPAAAVLEHAPAGARLAYRSPDGVPIDLILGPTYQSGLQVPCRMGRPGIGSDRGAHVFCLQDNQWYAMPPVVISGL